MAATSSTGRRSAGLRPRTPARWRALADSYAKPHRREIRISSACALRCLHRQDPRAGGHDPLSAWQRSPRTGLTLTEALGIDVDDVVALVGGGGKTTTMFRLAREIVEKSEHALTTTTTRIFAAQVALAP